jgi:steroid delta-isomerase
MSEHEGNGRVAQHTAAFNAAVHSGDWQAFAERFTRGATMRFVGVPAGPFVGRAAIAEAYAQQPPTDTLIPRRVASDGDVDTVSFAWTSGGTGTMRLTWERDLVAELEVTFDR